MLAVVIVTFNSGRVLRGLLDSLPEGLAGIEEYQVVVVDNDSRDDSVEVALAHSIGAKVIRTGRNAGYAAGINAAAATIPPHAHMLILNPDIRLQPGAARILCDRLDSIWVGIAVPQLLGEDGRISHSLRREPSLATAWTEALLGGRLAARLGAGEIISDPRRYARGGPVEWATGAAVMVAARARHLAGDWDESFFLYSEEVDYLRRVRQCGLSVEYLPRAKVVHIGGDYVENPFLSALMAANRIRDYGRRHGTLSTLLFRLGVITGEALRAGLGTGHRAALRAALGPIEPLRQSSTRPAA